MQEALGRQKGWWSVMAYRAVVKEGVCDEKTASSIAGGLSVVYERERSSV
jgi:hypothetical protein